MINIIFRYDDFSAESNTLLEESLLKTFSKYKIPITIGVVPFNSESSKSNLSSRITIASKKEKLALLNDGMKGKYIEVAQHGHSHFNKQKIPKAEFLGIDKKKQYNLISEGKNVLEKALNIKVKTFIPPWNRYNKDTLSVIEKLGFKNISAGTNGFFSDKSLLNFIPSTCSLQNLQSTINFLNDNIISKTLIIVLMHENDFLDKNNIFTDRIKNLDILFSKLIINENINFHLISEYIEEVQLLPAKKYFSRYRIIRDFSSQIPSILSKKMINNNIFPDTYSFNIFLLKGIFYYIIIIGLPTFIISNIFLSNFISIDITFIKYLLSGVLIFLCILLNHLIKKRIVYKIYLKTFFLFSGIATSLILKLF